MTTNDELKELLLKIQSDTSSLNKKVDSIEGDVKELRTENAKLSKDVAIYKRKYSELKSNNEFLTEKIVACESKIDYLLNKERENNLVLFKVKDVQKENENLLDTVKSIFTSAEVNIQDAEISKVRRLGTREGSRPILVSFYNKNSKSAVYRSAKNFRDLNVGFANDMTKELREKRKTEYKILREAKVLLEQQGKTAIIKGSKILMENVTYDVTAIQSYLYQKQGNLQNDDILSNYDSDDSSISTVSVTTRKRGRPRGSKPSLEKQLNKKSKNFQMDKSIREFCLESTSLQTNSQHNPNSAKIRSVLPISFSGMSGASVTFRHWFLQ